MSYVFGKKTEKQQAAMQRPCKGCVYLGSESCDYLLMVKKRRPCPPGENCTEYRKATFGSVQKRIHKGAMESAFPSMPKPKKRRKKESR